MTSEPVKPFNLNLKVDEEIRTALSAGHSVVVLGCKFSGKSRAAGKLARPPGLTVIDMPGQSGEEDYERVEGAMREASQGHQLAIFISHWHKDYFRTRKSQQNGGRKGVFDSKSFPHKDILLAVRREEAFGNTKIGVASYDGNSFLLEYLREYAGVSGGDFVYKSLDIDIELEQLILKGARYEQRGYETFVPPLIRVHAEALCQNRNIEEAIARKDTQTLREGFEQVKGLLKKREEETSFLHTVFGLDSSWFTATKGLGFETAMHVLKESLKAFLPFGSEIIALAGLGIAQGLWRRARGEKASVLGGLAEAGNLWKKMSEEEQRFLCYRLERVRKLEPDTVFTSLQNLFDPSTEIQKHLEEQINKHADKIWEALQRTPEAKVLLDRMDWFEKRLSTLEQGLVDLRLEVVELRLEGSVELTPSNVSERLGVDEEHVVGLGSAAVDAMVLETTREIVEKAGSGPVIISGEPGAGKTTMLYIVAKRLIASGKKARLIENPKAFELTREYSQTHPEEYLIVDTTKEGAREFLGKLHPYLDRRTELTRVIAAVRSDYLDEYLSGSEHSSKEKFRDITHLLAFSRDILEGIVDRWAGNYSPPAHVRPTIKEGILRRCEGSPFYITQALTFLKSKGFSENVLENLPEGVRGLIEGILDDLSRNDSKQLVAYYVISRYNHIPLKLVEAMRGNSALGFDASKRFYVEVGDEVHIHGWYKDEFLELLARVRKGEHDALANRLVEGIEDSRQLYLALSRAKRDNETLEEDWLEASVEDRLDAITWGLLIRVFRAHLSIDPYVTGAKVGRSLDERLHAALLGFTLHELFPELTYPELTPRKLMWIAARYVPGLMFSPTAVELYDGVNGNRGSAPDLDWLVSLQRKTNSPVDEKVIGLVTWALASMGLIRIDPEDHAEKAHLFRLLQLYDRELTQYDQAIHLRPNHPEYHSEKGFALIELGRHEEALEEFEKAIHLRPNHPEYHNEKGFALIELGRHEEALEEFEKAIHLRPSDQRYYGNKGAALSKLGRHAEAVVEFEKGIQIMPSHPDLYSNKGAALVELGRFENAVAEFDKAIRLNPSDPFYHYKKGNVLSNLGGFELALGEYDR